MALTIKPAAGHGTKGPLRGQKARSFVLQPDASKPAGGYTVLASALGFSVIDFGVVGDCANAALQPKLIIGTASTDFTVQWFIQTLHTATASLTDNSVGVGLGVSNTSVTTNPVAIYVIGR